MSVLSGNRLSIEEKTDEIGLIFQTEESVSSSETSIASELFALDTHRPVLIFPTKKKPIIQLSEKDGDICLKELVLSKSSVVGHPYYNYPAIIDPGIVSALTDPQPPIIYPDDGQQLYKTLCEEQNICFVRTFYNNLMNDEINLSYYGANPMQIRTMAMTLQNNTHVQRLNLTENFLDDDVCYHLGQMLKYNTTIQEIIFAGCRMRESGLVRVVKHTSCNRSLVALDLSRNYLEDSGGVALAKQMDNYYYLQRINLSSNQLGMKTAIALRETFEYKNTVTHLNLSWNLFNHIPTTVKLLQILALSEYLEELNLSWNALRGASVATAVCYIILIPTLKSLDISNNRFNDNDIGVIVQLLGKSRGLKTFNLSYNPISPVGAYAVIQKMLRPRVKIETLLLEKICVSTQFMECLQKVRKMKSRKNFEICHGEVVRNWVIREADPKKLILKRADYLGNALKNVKDIPLYLLLLSTEYTMPVDVKELCARVASDNIPLDNDYITELANVFPGPKSKSPLVNLHSVSEYIQRLWPEKKVPLRASAGMINGSKIGISKKGKGKVKK